MQIKLFITLAVLFTLPLAANSQSFGKGLDFDDLELEIFLKFWRDSSKIISEKLYLI